MHEKNKENGNERQTEILLCRRAEVVDTTKAFL